MGQGPQRPDPRLQRPDRHLTTSITPQAQTRKSTHSHAWIDRARHAGYAELRGFAAGLASDRDAVVAGLAQLWSSGPVEGQVNRIKTIKRQMYGRANLDLLRKRVLAT
ncbi:transposase [Micromonospora sp. KC721]|uniref:transposase n=1 Tax=Micromonospora sp. KC721 TaxID=2530380 RepID=UPI00210F48D2|nr:transposase [Micromonospora sp. KC721]